MEQMTVRIEVSNRVWGDEGCTGPFILPRPKPGPKGPRGPLY